jgi:hypothetical protein
VGLVRKSCSSGALSVGTVGAASGPGTAAEPLVIQLSPVGRVGYQVTAYLQPGNDASAAGSVFAIINESLPGGETGEAVAGAKLLLGGAGQSVTLSELSEGLYMADVPYTAGARYTLSIDVDGNGSVDGTGTVTAVGQVKFTRPTADASFSSASFTAAWEHETGGGASGAGILYWVSIVREDAADDVPQDFSWYVGTDRQYTPYRLDFTGQATQERLSPGTYTANLTAFSGPYAAATAMNFTVTPNITGTLVGGEFYSFGGSDQVAFTLTQ